MQERERKKKIKRKTGEVLVHLPRYFVSALLLPGNTPDIGIPRYQLRVASATLTHGQSQRSNKRNVLGIEEEPCLPRNVFVSTDGPQASTQDNFSFGIDLTPHCNQVFTLLYNTFTHN